MAHLKIEEHNCDVKDRKKMDEIRNKKLETWDYKKQYEKVKKMLINKTKRLKIRKRKNFEKNKIYNLPIELKNYIADYLLYKEIVSLSKISRSMRQIVDKNEEYWRQYFNKENENNKIRARKQKYIITKKQNYNTIKEYNEENLTNFLSFYKLIHYYKKIDISFQTCLCGNNLYILPHKGTRFVVSNGSHYENYIIYDVTSKKRYNTIENDTQKYSSNYVENIIKFKAYKISDDGKILSKLINGILKNTAWQIYIRKNLSGFFVNIDNNYFGCICKKGFIVDNYLDTPFIHNHVCYQRIINTVYTEKLSIGLTVYITTKNAYYYNYYMYYVHTISLLNNIVVEAIIKHIPINGSLQELDMKIILKQGKWIIEENKIDNSDINLKFGCYYDI